jgi:hypothetical protein
MSGGAARLRGVSRAITPSCFCITCGRPTTRLYGVGAAVDLADGSGIRAKGEVIGYCFDHRDLVLGQWRAALEEAGEVKWISEGDEIRDLRPAGVSEFLAQADSVFQQLLPQGEALNPGACPHCGSEVSWGSGPHVDDAKQRPGTMAWDCTGCGAAGLAYMPS